MSLLGTVANFLRLISGGRIRIHAGTAAELLALTDAVVNAGDPAIVIDQGYKWVEADVPGPASTTWYQRATEIVRYANNGPSGTDKEYLFAMGYSWSTNISGEERFFMPYPGEVRRWVYSSSDDPGDTTLGFHQGDFLADPTPTETVTTPTDTTVVGASGNFRIVAVFSAATFTANQILAFSCDPENAPGFNRGWIEIEFLKPLEA